MPRQDGHRLLEDGTDPWSENAWDDVEWGEEQERLAEEAIAKQKLAPVPDDLRDAYNDRPADYWDGIYSKVTDTMYKDRSWLRDEFPELAEAVKSDVSQLPSLFDHHAELVQAGRCVIAELGCGPGNTAFPLLAHNANPLLHLHALDFSSQAIDMVKANPACDAERITPAVWDVADPAGAPAHIEAGSVDIVISIFVLSALHPTQWRQAVLNIHQMLKPGGVLLFRDYGRHDLVQLRFKGARWMSDNLYVRGDGTRVYFFEKEELQRMFGPPEFALIRLDLDRRLLLNRKRKLQMWRAWMQGKWQKSEGTQRGIIANNTEQT